MALATKPRLQRTRSCLPSLTPEQLQRQVHARRVITLSLLDTKYFLVWLQNRENPILPIMMMADLLSRQPGTEHLLSWIADYPVIEHLHIPLRGFADFIYGRYVDRGIYGEYFEPCPPKAAKHLLLRVRWQAASDPYRRCRKPKCDRRHKILYCSSTPPDQAGQGYDFLVVPVWHQSNFSPEHRADHEAFVRSAIERHQAQWNLQESRSANSRNSRTTSKFRSHESPSAPQNLSDSQRRRPRRASNLPARSSQPARRRPQNERMPTSAFDELRRRAWKLYGDGYKALRIKLESENCHFLRQQWPYTRSSWQSLDRLLTHYEQQSAQRSEVYRRLLGLKTQFQLHGCELQLDVAPSPDSPTLAVKLNNQVYEYSETTVATLHHILQTIS